jgi:hypothetical protein
MLMAGVRTRKKGKGKGKREKEKGIRDQGPKQKGKCTS